MTMLLASARVEMHRLARSGLLIGLLAVFAFFGLLGPGLALYMPEILGAAAGTDQLTIVATAATPENGIALFNQSAMQLGLIFAVAVAITSLSWDTRAGSSIFYRTRVRQLSALTLPRLVIDWIAVITSYTVGFALAVTMTMLFIGKVDRSLTVTVWASSVVYLVMAMSVGYLIMATTRRTAAAIAGATVLMLLLPLLSQFEVLSAWVPTALLAGAEITAMPFSSAIVVTVVCVGAANLIATKQVLRRDA